MHAERRALREIHEQERVAHRVAQADHQRQSNARQHQDRGQKELVAREAAHAPEQVHQQERAEENADPQFEGALPGGGAPHHEERLQLAELLGVSAFVRRIAPALGSEPLR